MKNHHAWNTLGSVLVVGLIACNRDKPAEPNPAAASAPAAAGTPAAEASRVRYIERMTGGANTSDAVPIVVAIHGLGDRPESFGRIFDEMTSRARLILPYGLSSYSDGFSWFPISNLDPKILAEGTTHAANELAQMIGTLESSRPMRGKTIVTGFSQGGMLSFTLAVLHPERVGEALPIAGLLAPPLHPSSWPMGKLMPRVQAFHGDADNRVPIAGARDTVKALVNVGFAATLTEYPDVRHTVSVELRRDWLLALDAAIERANKL